MRKSVFKIIIIFILLIIYVYIFNMAIIPNNIVLFEGEKLDLKMITGLSLDSKSSYETKLTSTNLNEKINESGSSKFDLNLFGKVKLKTVNVDVIPTATVIPLGQAIGMKLYTKGVLVVGMSEIDSSENVKVKPYENSGIETGDSIIAVNNNVIENTDDLIDKINNSNGERVDIKYSKNNEVLETSITPAKTNAGYKIGLWVRDAAAGVGTLTFYEPSTNSFMSLGHGIADIDTEDIVEISNGELVTANILSIVKGKKDCPGEIRGTITSGTTVGKIYKNTNFGVFGLITNKISLKESNYNEVEVAARSEIKEGKATIICQLDNGEPKEFEIEIEKVYLNNNDNNKSMLIKITDEELLDKTGGIIQGMSGAPVMQDGKLIGAVTNVLVKDPSQGYAVFGDILIKQIRQTN